jgi:DNA-binding transcriptional ArsR family regulator
MNPTGSDNPYESLERVFHEPNRMAIVSALCAADAGIPFPELRSACGLTDGNLNRHLKVLSDAGIIRIEKTFVRLKPRTTVWITRPGLRRFQDYLSALGDALQRARQSLPGTPPHFALPRPLRTAET